MCTLTFPLTRKGITITKTQFINDANEEGWDIQDVGGTNDVIIDTDTNESLLEEIAEYYNLIQYSIVRLNSHNKDRAVIATYNLINSSYIDIGEQPCTVLANYISQDVAEADLEEYQTDLDNIEAAIKSLLALYNGPCIEFTPPYGGDNVGISTDTKIKIKGLLETLKPNILL